MNHKQKMRLAIVLLLFVSVAHAKKFHFVALGDTAYNPATDYPVYEALINRINASAPAFSIHVGDTWGARVCTEAAHREILHWFGKYDHPLIYTPGDNEWTDCRKPEAIAAWTRLQEGAATPEDLRLLGSLRGLDQAMASTSYDDPLGSLALIRQIFFSQPQSLGARRMPVQRQADVHAAHAAYSAYVENLRWRHGDVHFATVHVVGSNNGFTINNRDWALAAIERNQANVAWLQHVFAQAKAEDAKAVVIATHAGLFSNQPGGDFARFAPRGGFEGPYHWIIRAIRDLGVEFGKPVLLVQGDFHDLVIDQPFMVSRGESQPPLYNNITRLQVYGAPELKAVRVGVDPSTPWVFSFEPLYNP